MARTSSSRTGVSRCIVFALAIVVAHLGPAAARACTCSVADIACCVKHGVAGLESDVSALKTDVGKINTFLTQTLPSGLETVAEAGEARLSSGFLLVEHTLKTEEVHYGTFLDSQCSGFRDDLQQILEDLAASANSVGYVVESTTRIGLAIAEVAAEADGAVAGPAVRTRGRSGPRAGTDQSLGLGAAVSTQLYCPDVTPPPPPPRIDPSVLLHRLDGGTFNPATCDLLFPVHEILRATGEKNDCAYGDPADCYVQPLLDKANQVAATASRVASSFQGLECQVEDELNRGKTELCTAIAKLADPTNSVTPSVGWEDWQRDANLMKAVGGLAQQFGSMLQGFGDISINGMSVGASVAIEGDLRAGVDYANAAGKNISQIGADVQWIGSEIDKVVQFCRGGLNLKLIVCMLQRNQPNDYDDCHAGVLDPDSVDQQFGF